MLLLALSAAVSPASSIMYLPVPIILVLSMLNCNAFVVLPLNFASANGVYFYIVHLHDSTHYSHIWGKVTTTRYIVYEIRIRIIIVPIRTRPSRVRCKRH